MGKFHLYHISFFDSLLEGLGKNWVPLDKLTQHSYIKRFDLDNPDTYLPLEVGYEFLNKVKYSQGIDCISGEFYGGFEIEDLSDYGEYLSGCPDLYSILENAIKYDHLVQSHGKLYLKTEGALSWMCMIHTDPPSQGRHISERINVAMFVKAFQFVLGSEWTPLEIKITSPDGYWLKNLLPSSNFKLHTNCREIGFRFKTIDLVAKNNYYQDNSSLESTDLTSIEHATMKVFNSMSGNYLPTLEEFSDYFGMSKRTVIREFSKAGTSYKEMMNKHQFLNALKLIGDFSLSIDSISTILGYSHSSNFIKAFKRWTSTTPNQYRQQVAYL